MARYLGRVSGPLLDRIDLHIEVPPVDFRDLSNTAKEESSASIKARVDAARDIQNKRFAEHRHHLQCADSAGNAA